MLQHNQLLGSSLVLASGGVGASFMYSLKELPSQAQTILKRKFMTSITISSHEGMLYYYLSEWLNHQEYTKKARLLSAYIPWNLSKVPTGVGDEVSSITYTPAPGEHFFKYKNHHVWATKDKNSQTVGTERNLLESVTLKTVTGGLQLLKELLQEVHKLSEVHKASTLEVRINRPDYWTTISKRPHHRNFESVVLPKGVKEDIRQDLKRFTSSESSYNSLGIPYRRGFILFGPAGTGKTSVAECIAEELKRDLYILNLAAKRLDNSDLMGLFAEVSDNAVVLIEDVDCAFDEREQKDEDASKVTFAGLLNCLDGVTSKHGLVTVLTTNHIEKLDLALLRPGRADRHFHLDNATQEQAEELYLRFFPGSTHYKQFAMLHFGQSMASIQGKLIQYKDDEQALIKTLVKDNKK